MAAVAPGALSLTGPVTRTPGSKGTRRADIALTSPPRGAGVLGASFCVWAGSRTTTAADGTRTVAYPVRLRADLTLAPGTTAIVSAPLSSGTEKVTLTAEVLPSEPQPAASLASWDGSGSALRQLTDQGFGLGDSVLLTELSLVIDPDKLEEGLTEAVTEVTVKASARPTVAWTVAKSVAVTEVGAELTVTRPLTRERGATVTGYGTFTVTPALHMTAVARIPPGTFQLTQQKDTTAKLADVLAGFLPSAPAGLPDLTLSGFSGSTTPKTGEYSLTAKVATSWSLSLGAAEVELTGGKLKLDRKKKKKKEEKEKGEEGGEKQDAKDVGKGVERGVGKEGETAEEPRDRPDSSHEVTGTVSATAKLGPVDGDETVDFTATWTLPKSFALEGTFPEIELAELLKRLSCPLELPDGTPAVFLRKSKATLRAGKAMAGQLASEVHYELGLSTDVTFGSRTQHPLTLVGKAGRSTDGTFFAAALWQQDWAWSPKDVEGWGDVLGVLGDLTFRKSGLAVCTADGVVLDADAKLPDTLPKTLDSGLTFFTEVGYGEPLAFLRQIFPDTEGIRLRARLTRPIADSKFTALIGEEDTGTGFGALSLTIVPKNRKIELSTSFLLDLSAFGSPSGTSLRFVATGAAKKTDLGWSLSLSLLLEAEEAGGPALPGQPTPQQLSVITLDRPGHILLPATDPTHTAAAVPTAGGTPTDLPLVPVSKQRSVWRNAFGIEGFNIAYFYLEMRYDTDGFKLGGGGSVEIGPAALELAVHGRVGPPSVSAFYFSLTGTSPERGVTILDLVRIVAPDPAPALSPLDSVVVREVVLCAVADPDGWTNTATGQDWAPGFYAKGDIAFGTNTWLFQVRIQPTGLYISSQVDRPIELGGVFEFAGRDGVKGPQFLLDTGDLKAGRLPEKVFYLSGSLSLLGHRVLAVEALLERDGFTFELAVDIVAVRVGVHCRLNEQGLKARASVDLGFEVKLPRDAQIAGIPLGAGLLVGVHVRGEIEIDVTTGAMVRLSGQFSLRALDTALVSTEAELRFGIRSWSDVVDVLKQDPAKVLEKVATDVWETAKNCAVTTAGALM
ncbi:hypothetical protein ACWEWK_21750 [Streptomyces sp. NPDC003757]